MIKTYKECLEIYDNCYNIYKAIKNHKLYKIEDGIYSTEKVCSDLSIIVKKYPNAIVSGESAFYYYGFTDVVPDNITLATKSKAAIIDDKRVNQIFVNETVYALGVTEMTIGDAKVKIYDKERLLIELLRYKNSFPYDLYKEVLSEYRRIVDKLELWRIQEYASIFPKSKMIMKALDEEVL